MVPFSIFGKMFRSKSRHAASKSVQTESTASLRGQGHVTRNKFDCCENGSKLIYSRVPLGDCSNQRLNVRIGDMENEIVNNDHVGVTTQFQSIQEVQIMIRHLQKLGYNVVKSEVNKAGHLEAENTMTSNYSNGTKSFLESFEDLSILDADHITIDENETEWLTKVPGAERMCAKDLHSDGSFIDSDLLNVRFNLLNLVKSSIIEEKSTSSLSNSPRCSNNALTNLDHHHEKRMSPLSGYATITKSTSNITNYQSRPYQMTLRAVETASSSPPPFVGSARSSFAQYLSPSYPASVEKPISRDHYFSSPQIKGPIDSRTYTRPKKARTPLDTYSNDHIELSVSPIKHVHQHNDETFSMQPNAPTSNLIPITNMNETFVADFEEQPERVQQPTRGVTRNLSYVIRRDSESPNNNSPVQPPDRDNYESETAVELNNTFVRSREDTYSPSPTGSIHNTSSMEELHNLARQQEQSLRMTSNPRMLTRKETHTVVKVPVLDSAVQPIIRGATDGKQQQKMRIQSRIPAPGVGGGMGSRIRPPLNGATRRPIASGGIRHATDWQDGGAY